MFIFFPDNLKQEKCKYCFSSVNCKKYGITDKSKGYKATKKVQVVYLESSLKETTFHWNCERSAYIK